MIDSYSDFDKPYRRGLVLGLSLAELFLILIFLLLLVAISVVQFLEEDKEEFLDQIRSLKEENEKLHEQVKFVEGEKEKLYDHLTRIYKDLGYEITEEFGDFTETIKDENERLTQENKKLQDTLFIKDKELADRQQELNEADRENKELYAELEQKGFELLATKAELEQKTKNEKLGDNPPCWFTWSTDSDGERRRKHEKIFDVLIRDDTFKVRRHDNSQITKNINTGKENVLLYVDKANLNRDLKIESFVPIFSKIRKAGELKNIQDYDCRFMVDVYDQTSQNNKDGYKHNLSIVESVFLKTEIRGEQW